MKGKPSRILFVTITLLSILLTIGIVHAKPQYGEMKLYDPLPTDPLHPEYGILVWSGTITGDINGKMYFYNSGGRDVGQVSFFEETWLINDENGDMLLLGTDQGVVSWNNLKYRMNGVVTDAASEYANLLGHNVHMRGVIIPSDTIWQAPGVFRVN